MKVEEITLQILLKALDTGAIRYERSPNVEEDKECGKINIQQINHAFESIYDAVYSKMFK